MAKIKTDTVKLESTESSVREQISAIKKALTKLAGAVETLNAMWTGTANQAFNQTFQYDIQYLSAICDELEGIADFEKNAREKYVKCEQNVESMIDSISIAEKERNL